MSPRTIAAALVAALCLGVGATVALAHTHLEASSPRAGATISRLPAKVVLTFGEPTSRVQKVVVRRNGRGNLVRKAVRNPRDARRVLVTLRRPGPRWQPARYRVNWVIVGSDGHAVSGVVRFRVVR